MPYVTDSNAFEVIIGYYVNAMTVIRTTVGSETPAASEETPDVLNCTAMMPFWISWFEGHIKVGQGHVLDAQLLVEYNGGSAYTMGAKSFGAPLGTGGVWRVRKDSG